MKRLNAIAILIALYNARITESFTRTERARSRHVGDGSSRLAGFMDEWVPEWQRMWASRSAELHTDALDWTKTAHARRFVETECVMVRRVLDAYVSERRMYKDDRHWDDEMLDRFRGDGVRLQLPMGIVHPRSARVGSDGLSEIERHAQTVAPETLSNGIERVLGAAQELERLRGVWEQPADPRPAPHSARGPGFAEVVRLACEQESLPWPPENPLPELPRSRISKAVRVVGPRIWGDLLRGKRPLSRDHARGIAKAAGVNAESLLVEYELWRVNFVFDRVDPQSSIVFSEEWLTAPPEGYGYGFPEIVLLCLGIYTAIQTLWYEQPDIRTCENVRGDRRCGRLFLASHRGKEQRYCTTKCQQQHSYFERVHGTPSG